MCVLEPTEEEKCRLGIEATFRGNAIKASAIDTRMLGLQQVKEAEGQRGLAGIKLG